MLNTSRRLAAGAVTAALISLAFLPTVTTPAQLHASSTAHASSYDSSCVNGDCPISGNTLNDYGGPIITTPSVYIVEFSDSQSSLSPDSGFVEGLLSSSAPNVPGAIDATLNPPFSSWWMQEYSRPSSGEIISSGDYAGTIVLYNPALADNSVIAASQISSALSAAASAHDFPATTNDIFVTFYRSGQEITDGSENSNSTFCGYHSSVSYGSSYLNYAVLPNEAGVAGCDYAGTTQSDFNNMTPVLSHELAETITDPTTKYAWITPEGNEMADICADSYAAAAPVTYSGQTYWLQYFYSNVAQGCYNGSITPLLSATASSPTSLDVNLSATGAPLAGQVVLATVGSTTLATATTGANGDATLTIPAQESNTQVTVSFSGTGPLQPTSATVTTSDAALILNGPGSSEPGASFTITAQTNPALIGSSVTLTSSSGSVTATTNATGAATFDLTAPTTPGSYEYVATIAGTSLSSSLDVVVANSVVGEALVISGPATSSSTAVALAATLSPTLAGQDVTLSSGNTTMSDVTNAAGVASFSLTLAPGQYSFVASTTVGSQLVTSSPFSVVVRSPGAETMTLHGPKAAAANSSITYTATIAPALAGQDISVLGPVTSDIAITNSAGKATFTVRAPTSGTYTYNATAILADNSVLAAAATLTVASPLTLHSTPPVASPGSFTVTATLAPLIANHLVLLSGSGTLLHTLTNTKGVASFRVTATPGVHIYTASTTIKGVLTATRLHVAVPYPATLRAGESLRVGQSLTSPNGQYHFDITSTKLELLMGGLPLWSQGVAGLYRVTLVDGSLKALNTAGRTLWSSDTLSGTLLSVTNAGRLEISAGTRVLWSKGIPQLEKLLPA